MWFANEHAKSCTWTMRKETLCWVSKHEPEPAGLEENSKCEQVWLIRMPFYEATWTNRLLCEAFVAVLRSSPVGIVLLWEKRLVLWFKMYKKKKVSAVDLFSAFLTFISQNSTVTWKFNFLSLLLKLLCEEVVVSCWQFFSHDMNAASQSRWREVNNVALVSQTLNHCDD